VRRVGLDVLVVDAGVREQQRQLDVLEPIESVDVLGLHVVPGDDEYVVRQLPDVQVLQHREGVRPDHRQERVGGAVEHLHRRDVRLEVPMTDQFFDGFCVAHERTRYALVPQAVGVPDAVRAVQRAPLNVVQAEPALAVLHDFAGTLGHLLYLILSQKLY
jgi:hypothetical protein